MISRSPQPRFLHRQCRVLIADQHEIVRASVRSLLEAAPNIRVVAEAADGEDALAKIQQLQPDVALVDLRLPKLDGIEVLRQITSSSHPTRVLALTGLEDGRHVRESLAAGAAGYVPKSAPAADLIAAIHVVAGGDRYVHPRVAAEVVAPNGRAPSTNGSELSVREREVLRLIALGFTNKEIATKLEVSVKTVETYKARAMVKIGAASRVEIVRFAVGRGWLGREA